MAGLDMGSHDKPGIASKIGIEQARVAAMLLFTLPRTPIFYAGDEIGMPNVEIPPERVRDPFERLVPGHGLNRDPERTPMGWDAGENAGFTSEEPWVPIGDQIEDRNVASQLEDDRSILWLYRRLIALRQHEPALIAGRFEPQRSQGDVLLFERRLKCSRLVVAFNVSDREQEVKIRGEYRGPISTHLDHAMETAESILRLRRIRVLF